MAIAVTPGSFVGTLHEVCFGRVQIFRETTSQSVHEAGGACKSWRSLGVPLAMAGTGWFRGHPVRPGVVMALAPGEDLEFYAPPGLDALRTTLLCMLESLDANPTALLFAAARRLLEETVLGAIVAMVDGNGEAAWPTPVGGRCRVVERARSFMHAHIDEPITVAELCKTLGVSRRTLQYSFQDVLGLNPVRFLRALRLNGVRRELRHPPPATTVQDAAARWGFWHLGHFVTDYRQMFGELPSETLRGRWLQGPRRGTPSCS